MLETDILTEHALRRRRGELNGTCTEPWASSALISSATGRAAWLQLKSSALWRFGGGTSNERHTGVTGKKPECFPFMS